MKFHNPKTAHRFRVSFGRLGLGHDSHDEVLTNQVVSVERPHFTQDADGARAHTPFKIVLRDDSANIVAQNVMHQYRVGTRFSVTIEVMDDRHEHVVEHIKVERCRLLKVEHSPLRYNSPDPSTVTLVIEPEVVRHVTFERMTILIKDGKPVL